MTTTILPGDDAEARVWATALEVGRLFADVPWVLIGAQMVMLLEGETGRPSGRTTGDVDAVVDVRVLVGATRVAAERLVAAGFEASDPSRPYRFVNHLGRNADLTTIPPASTIGIPGASRALQTRRELEVDVIGVGSGVLPVPTIAGAIVLKLRAWEARRELQRLHPAWRAVSDPEDARAAYARIGD